MRKGQYSVYCRVSYASFHVGTEPGVRLASGLYGEPVRAVWPEEQYLYLGRHGVLVSSLSMLRSGLQHGGRAVVAARGLTGW